MKTAPNQKIRCYFNANLLKGAFFMNTNKHKEVQTK